MIDLNMLLLLNFLALSISILLFSAFYSDEKILSLSIIILCLIMSMFIVGVLFIDVCVLLINRTG